MKIAMLGCGYVANMYRLTMGLHPGLELAGVYDRERSRAENMAKLTGAKAYADPGALLADDTVPLVLNLTNPAAHAETTRALLEAGKHVYTEKPIALGLADTIALADLAKQRGLMLCSAPCTALNPVARTLAEAVRDQSVGPIRLVYAEMDDGMVARAPHAKWVNEAGTAWPAMDEFRTGCTLEHAGYVLSWLCALFGPAERVTAFSDVLMPEKIAGRPPFETPDFSVACVRFRSGVTARLTNGIYAAHDHRMRLFGDEGVLTVDDPRSDNSPVRLRRYHTIRRRRFLSPISTRLRPSREARGVPRYRGSQVRDFCRAIADMALAIEQGRPPTLATDFGVHVNEITLACQSGGDQQLQTSFEAMEVPSWAA
ncbi:MAG: Gfo/Idh/MocA family oxidoreductase [Pseudomonadota bacterium]